MKKRVIETEKNKKKKKHSLNANLTLWKNCNCAMQSCIIVVRVPVQDDAKVLVN